MDIDTLTPLQLASLKDAAIHIHTQASVDAKLVLAIAGNGTEAIGWLMRHGRSTNTLLCQHVLTAQSALYDYLNLSDERAKRIGFKAAHEETARKLAYRAFLEAKKLNPSAQAVGLGATSSLVKPDGEREGRSHDLYIARHSLTSTHCLHLKIIPGRTREQEEALCAFLILQEVALARGCQIDHLLNVPSLLRPDEKIENYHAKAIEPLQELTLKQRAFYTTDKSVDLTKPCIIYSGRWNPLHAAHRAIFQLSKQQLKMPAIFELSLLNADKGGLDWLELTACREAFEKENLPLVITALATFEEKAKAFAPSSVFAMGSDTLMRVLDPSYYANGRAGLLQAIDTFKNRNNRFFVVARKQETGLLLPRDIPGFELIAPFTIEVPPEVFCMPHRSKDLREAAT